MLYINYFLASFLSWLGLIAGIILMKIAPEEKKPLSKTFNAVSVISISLIFFFTLFYYYSRIFEILVLAAYALFLIFSSGKIDDSKSLMVNYPVLAVILFLSINNANLFAINASLIFIYGAAKSSSLFNPRKNNFKFLAYSLTFLVISNILFFIK